MIQGAAGLDLGVEVSVHGTKLHGEVSFGTRSLKECMEKASGRH